MTKKVGVRSIFTRENFPKLRLFQAFRGQIHKNKVLASDIWKFLPVKKSWKSQKSAREKKWALKKLKKVAESGLEKLKVQWKKSEKWPKRPLLVFSPTKKNTVICAKVGLISLTQCLKYSGATYNKVWKITENDFYS